MTRWNDCADADLKIDDLVGEPCYIGLDLASKLDIAAMVFLFPRPDGKFALFGKYYVPESRLNPDNNNNAAQYHAWSRAGKLCVTPGNIIDFSYIKDDLLDFAKRFEVVEVCYDPFQATQFVVEVGAQGLTMVEVGATLKNFSEPMKRLEALVEDNKLAHDGDPVMTWMMSCVTGHYDKKENIYPNKEGKDAKIDGPVAAIMALSRAQLHAMDNASAYDDHGILTT